MKSMPPAVGGIVLNYEPFRQVLAVSRFALLASYAPNCGQYQSDQVSETTIGKNRNVTALHWLSLSPADISRDVMSESCHTSARWSVNGYVALITDETSGLRVVDHNAVKI